MIASFSSLHLLQNLIKLVLLFICISFFSLVSANEIPLYGTDLREDQLYIQADSMQYDDQKKITTYTGDVYAKQTHRELFGDTLIVHYNEDKTLQEIEVFGEPAKYSQTKTHFQEEINARALYIKYIKEGELLQLKNEVYLDKTDFQSSSDSLIYKINTGEVRAESSTKKRVEMIIY